MNPTRAQVVQSTREHAKLRAKERYGLTLNKEALRKAVRDIQAGKAEFVKKESGTRTQFIVIIDEKPCLVVYSTIRHTIVTFLPLTAEVITSKVCSWLSRSTSGNSDTA